MSAALPSTHQRPTGGVIPDPVRVSGVFPARGRQFRAAVGGLRGPRRHHNRHIASVVVLGTLHPGAKPVRDSVAAVLAPGLIHRLPETGDRLPVRCQRATFRPAFSRTRERRVSPGSITGSYIPQQGVGPRKAFLSVVGHPGMVCPGRITPSYIPYRAASPSKWPVSSTSVRRTAQRSSIFMSMSSISDWNASR